MKAFLLNICTTILTLAVSWVASNAFIYLIMLCLDLEYTLKLGTGIWLCITFLRGIFPILKGEEFIKHE